MGFGATPGAMLLLALAAAFGEWRTLSEALLAAALHELSHLLAIGLLGQRTERITLTAAGPRIDLSGSSSYLGDAIIAAAGPLGSLLAAELTGALIRVGLTGLRAFAGLNLLYCLLNLLPVSALDGGRVLTAAVSALFGPEAAAKTLRICGVLSASAATALGVYVFAQTRGNISLLLCAIFLWKVCCNEGRYSVRF